MSRRDIEILPHMVYHCGYAVRMETYIPDPNLDPFPVVPVFELDRIDDFRDAIDRGYLDVAASYGDLYRMIPLDIALPATATAGCAPQPRYAKYRTRMEDVADYVVEMQTELRDPGSPWAESIALQDLPRLNAAREALERGDLETAAQYGKIYRLEPVDIAPAAQPWRPSQRRNTGTPADDRRTFDKEIAP